MKLIAYTLGHNKPDIRPAPLERTWMSATSSKFAYRCLPLNIANQYGWQIHNQHGFTAVWNGGREKEALLVIPDEENTKPALSHFAHGILTFSVNCLFRTDEGYDLFVRGPTNMPKDKLIPLDGVVETDWSPYSFTMNWIFTRPGGIRFERGEPFCQIIPIKRQQIEDIEPIMVDISTNPELQKEHSEWGRSRADFLKGLHEGDQEIRKQGWQKRYTQGRDMGGEQTPNHRTRVKLKEFNEARQDLGLNDPITKDPIV